MRVLRIATGCKNVLILPRGTVSDYQTFLDRKSQLGTKDGFSPVWMPDFLFDFQKSLVEWALFKGKAAIIADCGLGKSPMELVWAENVRRKTNKPVLLLSPLAVSNQMVREAEKFGIDCKRSNDGTVYPNITTTNYERLHLFKPEDWSGVVCDECFPKNTPIDTLKNGCILKKYIQDVRHGDTIINATGRDRVAEIHRRKVEVAVKIKVGGNFITTSENHPFFTQRGWVSATDLRFGDSIMETIAAMRLVLNGVQPKTGIGLESSFLREILLSEMENAANADSKFSAFGGGCSEARSGTFCVFERRKSGSIKRATKNARIETDPRITRKDEPDIASDGAQTFRAWRKRNRHDEAAIVALGGAIARVEGGICRFTWKEGTWISDLLQTRLSKSRNEIRNRGGWAYSPKQKGPGFEKGCQAGFVRVDGIEILELGHPELDQWRDAEGVIYFYDIKAERHPSFSVNGLLVHNSSILKNFSGQRKKDITRFMAKIPYRLLGTATAAPNDFVELGTSSEALGELPYMDVLQRFFVDDKDRKGSDKPGAAAYSQERQAARVHGYWRLKGHSESAFWKWVCSWARACRKPSDLGFSDEQFKLPPLIVNETKIENERPLPGEMFIWKAVSLAEQRAELRATLRQRCEKVAQLCAPHSISVLWCDLNDEGDLLERIIPGAVQIAGKDCDEAKEEKIEAFLDGKINRLVSKGKITGFGLNLQICNHTTFFPSHSWEKYYQSVRRFWRFGQKLPVYVDIITTEGEAGVLRNLQRKSAQADRMFDRLVQCMNESLHIARNGKTYNSVSLPQWISPLK